MKAFISILFILFIVSCHKQRVEIITLDIDKSSIPEGIAVHPDTGELLISSIHLDKITRSDPRGESSADIIASGQNGFTTALGMDTAKHFLFALGSIQRQKRSMLLQIDLDKNMIVNSYTLNDSIPNFFNDLAIDQDLNAYITDTDFHRIYKFNYKSGVIDLFLEHEQIKYPNGIAIAADQTKLFIDSYSHGIRIVDIKSKRILNEPHTASAKTGIDGLKYYKNSLYAIVNGGNKKERHGLVKFELSAHEDNVLKLHPLLLNHPKMNIPTTMDIVNGNVYILANSQLDNLDQEKNKIIDPGSLTPTYILKMRLKNND